MELINTLFAISMAVATMWFVVWLINEIYRK